MHGRDRALAAVLGSSIAVAGLGGLGAAIMAGGRSTTAVSPIAGPTTGPTASPSPSPQSRFVPPISTEGDVMVMPIVFPDGTTAELSYPADLAIHNSWIQGFHAFEAGCTSDITLFWGDGEGRGAGEAPIERREGPGGERVELWPASEPSTNARYYVLFDFGGWTVSVHNHTRHGAEACMDDLTGFVGAGGWLALEAADAARLVPPAEHMGPELAFIGVGENQARWLLLFPGGCDPWRAGEPRVEPMGRHLVQVEATFGSWCDTGAGVKVHVYTDGRAFVEAVAAGLEIRDVRLAAT